MTCQTICIQYVFIHIVSIKQRKQLFRMSKKIYYTHHKIHITYKTAILPHVFYL